ncbi:hypothetical protein [Caballeronia sordidicola]|uniref:hypothetical protein n=1 Tax=Caballeronia sordidicola TaxID=196367 RepID=UPI000B78EEF3|nr:hypothetical protein [Caballeronia sordidicola]
MAGADNTRQVTRGDAVMEVQNKLIEAFRSWREVVYKEAARRQSPAFAKEADKILSEHLALITSLHSDMHDAAAKRTLAEYKKVRRSLELGMKEPRPESGRTLPEFASDPQAELNQIKELRKIKNLDQDILNVIDEFEKSHEDFTILSREIIRLGKESENALYDHRQHMNGSLLLRIMSARGVHFAGKHLFTLLFVVLVCGYLYSKACTTAVHLVVEYGTANPLVSIFLLWAGLIFKEYILSKYVKRIRIKLETRLLSPVARAIFDARTHLLFESNV